MEPSPTPQSQRRDPDGGRVAVPEIAELLHLQRPAAAVGAVAVVLLALLVTLVAPDALPANVVTGAIVGVFALLVAVATAVLLDGRDPVLRGPRHLRRDGRAVLARMAGPDPVEHGGPVLAALERRLEGREHLGVVLTGSGCDPSELAVTLGRAAAADGHTALVVDLRASGAPGVADVGEGTVRLGEAARLADDRPYAWIGAGVDREAAARATAGVARRPPRDLKLLLVVAPEAATHVPEVLRACDRTVLLVAADTQQRAMVTARLEALERAGGRPEAIVVGGVRAVAGESSAIDSLGSTGESTADGFGAAGPTTAATAAATSVAAPPPEAGAATAPAVPASAGPAEPEEDPEPAVPVSAGPAEPEEGPAPAVPETPATPPIVPEEPEPDEPEATAPPAPAPAAPPVHVPAPESVAPDTAGDDDTAAAPATVEPPHSLETPAAPESSATPEPPAARESSATPEPPAAPAASGADDEAPSARAHDPLADTGPLPPVFRTAGPRRRPEATPESAAPAPAPAEPADPAPAEPTAPEPAAPRAAASRSSADPGRTIPTQVGDTDVEGMAEPDALLTLAALDELVSDQRRERDAG